MTTALSTSVVAGIEDLELAARLVVEGLRAGSHRSPMHGFSSEFHGHRPYRAGDDLKYLDWKLLARTDRLYSRVFRETTSFSLLVVLDASASMRFPEAGLSKWRYAQVVSAALSHLVISQGDAAGLLAVAGDRITWLPARGGRPQLRSLVAAIDKLEPSGSWVPERAIGRAAELLKRRGVILVVSDFLDATAETRRELRRVSRFGHDVGMLHLVADEERRFPYEGNVLIESMETTERLRLDASIAGAAYRERFEAFLARCRDEAIRDHVDYALVTTSTPPERALRDFLIRRAAGRQVASSSGEGA
jgi:uncharacterized protein (DUF58 family)